MSKRVMPKGTEIVHGDVETNGISRKDSSLLSICLIDGKTKEVYERYYYPKEDYNDHAIKVNGLTEEATEKKRGNCTYPNHFIDDQEDLAAFLKRSNVFVAFNVKFDFKWLPEEYISSGVETYCTMANSKDDVQAVNVKGHRKNPNLKEAVEYYGIMLDANLEKTANESEAVENYHDAKSDVMNSMYIFEAHRDQQ